MILLTSNADIELDRNVAIPKADLDATGRQSIALSDDSDRVVINLDVFHSLHCLNYIRESIFYEYYKSKISKTVERSHIGHCIADLVSALKCHADISMQTYRWKQGRLLPWPQFDIEHECRNWESIMEWSKERSVDLQGPILQHPELGMPSAFRHVCRLMVLFLRYRVSHQLKVFMRVLILNQQYQYFSHPWLRCGIAHIWDSEYSWFSCFISHIYLYIINACTVVIGCDTFLSPQ